MKQLITDILRADDRDPSAGHSASLLVSEDGMVSFVAMIAVLFFVILIGLIGNVGLTVSQKMEVQNAADSTAYSSGVLLARGMNSVTAGNHIIGEVLALAVLHHGILGQEGDSSFPQSSRIPDRNLSSEKFFLKSSHFFAKLVKALPGTDARLWPDSYYNSVKKGPESYEGAMMFRSKVRLMKVLTGSYRVWTLGAILSNDLYKWWVWLETLAATWGNVGAANAARDECERVGERLVAISTEYAEKVNQEWRSLMRISQMARSTRAFKRTLRLMIGFVHISNLRFAYGLNGEHEKLLEELSKRNAADSFTYFGRFGHVGAGRPLLPVAPEPTTLNSPRKSQLVRSAWPWIKFWRKDLLEWLGNALMLSRAAHHYKDFTNLYTIELATELKRSSNVNLLVMRGLDLNSSDKGQEDWGKESMFANAQRDRLFAHISFARRDRPALAGSGFYRPENEDGFVAYSQAIIYNANEQVPDSAGGYYQPHVGWDTLNWINRVPEYQAKDGHGSSTWAGGNPDPPHIRPRMYLNWRTKLVPVSRLSEAANGIPTKFSRAVSRLPLREPLREPRQFRTH